VFVAATDAIVVPHEPAPTTAIRIWVMYLA
jgi:hypothetical protein